jgi:hypothetical protein
MRWVNTRVQVFGLAIRTNLGSNKRAQFALA